MKNIDWVVTICIFILFSFLILQPINLTAVDLGRHLKNGELLLKGDYQVLYQNVYSYTNPEYPFVNHHWLSGVVFYLIHQLTGFSGLSWSFLGISLLTLYLFFDLAYKKSDIFIVTFASIVLMPMLISRTEIRPEIFSYLFLGIYFWLLHKQESKWLWLLIPLQLLWVNLHIYFIFGIGLVGLFLADSFIQKVAFKSPNYFKKLLLILIGIVLISIANPLGINGLFYPLLINQNYGYQVLENQNLWFLFKVIKSPMAIFFGIGALLLWCSYIYKFQTEKKKLNDFFLVYIFLAIGATFFGFVMQRNVLIFALFALPIISANLKSLTKKYTYSSPAIFSWITIYILIGGLILISGTSYWENRQFGVGLYPGIEGSAQFFKKQPLKGPVFNNYDIGSYLVYELYPQEKVFVDNRPEAFPVNFLQNVYIASQEDDMKWQELDAKYQFNSIFFYRHDLTPWAQKFLIAKVNDPLWAPVYVDDFSIIFVKRNAENESIIKQFELPKSMFQVKE